MTWLVDHKKFGSLKVIWSAGLLPSVPVLNTTLECVATSDAYLDGEMDIRGFIQPGGSVSDGILTCESFPGLAQGRDHAGAWTDMGKWARVSREENFVEVYSDGDGVFFCEDYGKEGCHFSVFSGHDRKRTSRLTWIFGATEADDSLTSVYRAHRK